MPRSTVKPLAEYAKENPPRGVCWACSLPPDILAQVNEGFAAGISQATIFHWLESVGYEGAVTRNKLRNHSDHAKAR